MRVFRRLRHSVLMPGQNMRAALRISLPHLGLLFAAQVITLGYQASLTGSGFAAPPIWMIWVTIAASLGACWFI